MTLRRIQDPKYLEQIQWTAFWLILTGWRSDPEGTVSLTGSEGEWKPLGKRGHKTFYLRRTVSSLSDMVAGPETIWNGRNALKCRSKTFERDLGRYLRTLRTL
jgi:hypothetical protein